MKKTFSSEPNTPTRYYESPRDLLRFSLFTGEKLPLKGRPVYTSGEPMTIKSRRGQLVYQGEQLDVYDATTLLALIKKARLGLDSAGNPRLVYQGSLHDLVKAVKGRSQAKGRDYRVVKASIRRMAACALSLEIWEKDRKGNKRLVQVTVESGFITRAQISPNKPGAPITLELAEWMAKAIAQSRISLIDQNTWRRLGGYGKLFYLYAAGQPPKFRRSLGNLMRDLNVSARPARFWERLERDLKLLQEAGVLEYSISANGNQKARWVLSWELHLPNGQKKEALKEGQ